MGGFMYTPYDSDGGDDSQGDSPSLLFPSPGKWSFDRGGWSLQCPIGSPSGAVRALELMQL